MRTRLLNLADRIAASYWFWPTALSLAALVLAYLTVGLFPYVDLPLLEALGTGGSLGADSARALLGAIATATLSVAGVTFSILIAAVVFATSQFGPRIVASFMRDPHNQVVLGSFIATFLYCVVVLGFVNDDFVPKLAVLIAMLLGVACVFMLIHFLHHAPESIRLSTIIASVGRQLVAAADRVPAEAAAGGTRRVAAMPPGFATDAVPVLAPSTGYVRFLDVDALMEAAETHDLVLRIDRKPGAFVPAGRPLAWAVPAGALDEAAQSSIRAAYSIGSARTPAQDVDFLVEQLMDVAARALSPGVNDPYTAISCLHWLTAGLLRAAEAGIEPDMMSGAGGTPRLFIAPGGFIPLLELSFGRLGPYFAADPSAALAMMEALGTLALAVPPGLRGEVAAVAARFVEQAEECLPTSVAKRDVAARHAVVRAIASGTLGAAEAMGAHSWL